MVIFAEINKTGEEHAMFNASMLKIVSNIFGNQHITVFIDKDHLHKLSSIIKVDDHFKLEYIKVINPLQGNLIIWIAKLVLEILNLVYILTYAKIKKAELVYFTSLSPTANLAASILTKYVFTGRKIVITFHGELELIKIKEDKMINKWLGKLLRRAITLKNDQRKYLLLGEAIKCNLLSYKLVAEQDLFVIEHPYIFQVTPIKRQKLHKAPIIFGHLGVAKLSKNTPLFFKLALLFKEEIAAGLVKFKIIGQVLDEMQPFLHPDVEYSSINELISRVDYNLQCQEIDYALFFYDNEAYELCSSGAILDAITYGKPILSLNNSYFKSIFNLVEQQPGFLFSNLEEFMVGLKSVIAHHHTNYSSLGEAVDSVREKLNIHHIEGILKAQLIPLLKRS
ncbi:MAG: hypothetical protein ACOH2A_06790 [Sphingobacteriaceae bacterium]